MKYRVVIPYGITTIEGCAFWGASIESLVIPETVVRIECYAFEEVFNLTNVVFEDPSNWKVVDYEENVDGETYTLSEMDLSDPSIAAEYLTNTYSAYFFEKIS